MDDEFLLEKGYIKIKSKKIAKSGPDHLIILPRIYIQNGIIDPDEVYDVYLRPSKKKQ